LEFYKNDKTADEIQKLTGATKASVTKYIQSYEKSKKNPKAASEYFAKKLNANEFCEFYYVRSGRTYVVTNNVGSTGSC
jgi:hypothetical protein